MPLMRPRDLIVTFEDDGQVLIRSTSRGAGARAPAFAVGVLAACTEPRERDEVVQMMGPVGGQAYDGLADADLLVPPEIADDTPTVFHNYTGVEVHRAMLGDTVRLDTYMAALEAVVTPDDVVIDAGSGTGVLAVMAALCGARKVYAIERTDFAQVIPQVAADSGVGERVEVIRGDFGQVTLPEKATVMVTETFGHWALAEGMMPEVMACVARNMVAEPRIVPRAVSLYLAPIAERPADLLGPFSKHPSGVDLSALRADASGRGHDRAVSPDEVGTAQLVGTVPMPNDGTFSGKLVLDAPCEALGAWFTLHMTEGIDMPTGPADPLTHWKQTLLPIALDAGTHDIEAEAAPEDRRTLVVTIGDRQVRIR